MKKQILIITGPTASGKTDLAIKCANLFNGEIISADSMQIYNNLDIGTAKPTNEEQKKIKHYLIDVLNPDKDFSVQEYVKLADKAIDETISKGKLPIIVGGTGLFIKSLILNFSFCSSPKSEEIRNKYNKILQENGKEFLHNLLQKKDKITAKKIHINDTKRVIRALEIFDLTGKSKSILNKAEENELRYKNLLIVLDIPRETLYERINLRVEKMFAQGLENEIKNLLSQNKVSKKSQSMQAIGYKEFFDYFENKKSLTETKDLIKQHSRNYAKRQITFFKGFQNSYWFNPITQKQEIFDLIKKEIINEN